MDEKYLNEIRHERDKEPVCTWQYVEVKDHNVRVYFKPESEIGLGFIFYAVENIGHVCVPETENNEWPSRFYKCAVYVPRDCIL